MTIATQIYTMMVHEAEEGGYWAEILELPGCVSQAETIDELKINIREALEAVLGHLSEDLRVTIAAPTEIHLGALPKTWTGVAE